ncbi:hypothetical protein R6242_19495 [Iodobacter sp. CM08]|uniref:hypothetical protein n=1 Tax=Iodobacter sp. CM08 TaxID=3085902 RepID=UPI002982520C|nr:hypothetical protein [Iodobacter sp. CM08]MDW5418757.1 hypothetical protein [Iodobacter sp. CM08]
MPSTPSNYPTNFINWIENIYPIKAKVYGTLKQGVDQDDNEIKIWAGYYPDEKDINHPRVDVWVNGVSTASGYYNSEIDEAIFLIKTNHIHQDAYISYLNMMASSISLEWSSPIEHPTITALFNDSNLELEIDERTELGKE